MAANPALEAAKTQWTKLRKNFTTGQLTVGGLLATTLIGGGAMFYGWASQPQYSVLFTNLSDKDASAVVTQLQADGVSFQLQQGGSAVLVPSGQVDSERLALASKDLPKGSTVGYELLDNQPMTTSSHMEDVNTQRALEGELDRTLSSMNGVSSAQVHLVVSEEKLFSSESSPARASVMLTTNGDLGEDQVTAITHLVASSVANLDPKNVSVTDQDGHVLSNSGSAGTSTSQLKLTNAVSDDLTVQASSMLDQILGQNKAIVRVSATLDFNKHSQKSETYDPTHQAITHQTTTGEQYNGANADAQGAVTTNPTAAPTTNSSSTYNKSSTDTTFGVSRIVSDDKSTPGQIKRLTASVVLDAAAAKRTSPTQVQAMVANAIGLDPSRGDQITVSTASFDTTAQATADKASADAAAARQKAQMLRMVETGGGVAVLILVAGMLLWVMRRPKGKDLDLNDPTSLEALNAVLPAAGTVTEPTPARLSTSGSDVDPAYLTPTERIMRRVDQALETDPESVASVLRSWMVEDDQK